MDQVFLSSFTVCIFIIVFAEVLMIFGNDFCFNYTWRISGKKNQEWNKAFWVNFTLKLLNDRIKKIDRFISD